MTVDFLYDPRLFTLNIGPSTVNLPPSSTLDTRPSTKTQTHVYTVIWYVLSIFAARSNSRTEQNKSPEQIPVKNTDNTLIV
jgi:hypothetical protein